MPNIFKVVAGTVLAFAGVITANPNLVVTGFSLWLSGATATATSGTRKNVGAFRGNVSGANVPVPLVYGRTRLPAIINDKRDVAASEEMYIPAVFAHGSRDGLGVAQLGAITFDDRPAFNAAGTAQSPFTTSNAKVTKLLGTSTQSFATASINSTSLNALTVDWDTNDKGGGMAGAVFYVKWDPSVYAGIPVISCEIKGNFVEDTRSEVSGVNQTFAAAGKTITRASGSFVTDGYVVGDRVQVVDSTSNDGSYTINTVAALVLTVDEALTDEGPAAGITLKRWAHPDNGGDNPVLCIRDYLLSTVYGRGLSSAVVDMYQTEWETMADFCDDSVNIPDGLGGTTTATRFQCRGWIDTGRTLEQNLADLLSSCRGNLVYQNGGFRIFITRAVTPSTIALTKDNVVGDWNFGNAGADRKFNVAEASYIDAGKRFLPDLAKWPNPGDSNGYLTADNSWENRLEISLPMTQNVYMAEQILMVLLAESRQGITAEVTCKEEAMQLQFGDVVPVTHDTSGWSGKNFWVTGTAPMMDSHVRVFLREYDSSSYTHGSQNDVTTEPDTDLPDPFTISAPTSLVLTGSTSTSLTLPNGDVVPRLKITWTDSTSPFVDYYEVQTQHPGDAAWVRQPDARPGEQTAYASIIQAGSTSKTWDVRVRAVSVLDVKSSWLTGSTTVDPAPEITSFVVSEPTASTARATWAVDEDVVRVRLYLKTDASTDKYPTDDYTATGVLDETKLVAELHIKADGGGWDYDANAAIAGGLSWSKGNLGTNHAAFIAIPIDRNGDVGNRASGAITLAGSATAALTASGVTRTTDGSSCSVKAQNTVTWTPNGSVSDVTHDLKIYRSINGSAYTLVKTEASPSSTTSWVDIDIPGYYDAGGVRWFFSYRLDLVDGVPTVLDSDTALVDYKVTECLS